MALGEDEQFDFKLPSPCSLKTPTQFVNLLSCQDEAATPTSPRLADANAEFFSFHVGGWFKNDGSSLPLVNADEVFHKWKLLSKSSLYPAAATILQSNDRKVNTPARTPSNIQGANANGEGRGTQVFGIGSTRCRESRYGRLKEEDVIVSRGGSDKQNVQRKLTPQHKIFNEKGASSLKKDTTATKELKKKTFLPYHMNTMFGCINWDSTLNSIRRGIDHFAP